MMTITKCDKCGVEIPTMDEVHIVQFGMWSSPHIKPRNYELCEKCAKKVEWSAHSNKEYREARLI